MKLEAVPNFSEGRDRAVVEAITRAMGDVVLDWSMDADHHRSVVTAAGEPGAVVAAAFRGAAKAVELIDLRRHHGVHPRVGAIDVLPFVPLTGEMPAAVEAARQTGERIWQELKLPVFFYEEAARAESRRRLPDVRRLLKQNPLAPPDIGDAGPHPTAGAVVVGARRLLIAYNVNLATADVAAAKAIAARLRLLPGVRALGLLLASQGVAQVSMNLTDYHQTGIAAAFQAVVQEAAALGLTVKDSELIGMAPPDALDTSLAERVRLRDFHPGRILRW